MRVQLRNMEIGNSTNDEQRMSANQTFLKNFFAAKSTIPLLSQIFLIACCLIFIFGVLGNSIVIYVAIRKKNYRNVTNCYVINLAIADLLFLTLSIPYTTYLGVVNTTPFGDTFCKVYTYLAYGFLQATCNIIAVMSIDRYLYIVRTKSKLRWRTPRNAFIICITIWACSLILIIPYHIISHLLVPNLKSCSVNEHENLVVCFIPFCSYYAIPLLIIIICYTNLALHVIKSSRKMAGHMNTVVFHRTVQVKQRRVTRMVIVVTLAFAICWLPIHILELLKCANLSRLNSLISSYPGTLYAIRAITHALGYFNSCLNPYLYALLNRNFCRDLVDIMPSLKICCTKSSARNRPHSDRSAQPSPANLQRQPIQIPKYDDNDEEDDSNDHDHQQITMDASCQVKLLGIQTKLT
ncbi:unnamed protein product [Adineta ricciae]|uniref:G-protein coupled receptors family 1 profile domain-containing protein n=1 Tax=Adineta ricciae TaxID=249248 RepID=A0A813VD74_ADIRI|nr:unnamed protein product [Adineta ricciae]